MSVPTFTLALNCYKVERFIDAAVDGAFSQTYRPLEIVISDDHSPDRTWEKILDRVAGYGYRVPCSSFVGTFKATPLSSKAIVSNLEVVLNRNPKNMGLALHQNRLFEISSGTYIAFQAGDDISSSVRMSRIAEVAKKSDRCACLHSAVEVIDAEGGRFAIPETFRRQRRQRGAELPAILGAGAVYHRDVYEKFGPLGPFVKNEDHVLPLRASLIGKVLYLNEPLVRYRKHGANLSGVYEVTPEILAYKNFEALDALYPSLCDVNRAEVDGLIDLKTALFYRELLEREIFLQWFLGNWRRYPKRRLGLLWRLLTRLRDGGYLLKRVSRRFLGSCYWQQGVE